MAFGIEELTHGNDFILGIIGGVAIGSRGTNIPGLSKTSSSHGFGPDSNMLIVPRNHEHSHLFGRY